MRVGVLYSDIKIVEEVFQLLKIPWEQYIPEGTYDVVIAHKSAIPGYKGVFIDLSIFNIFLRIDELLNNGNSNLHIPECDIILEDLRNQLKQHAILIEISPSPWDYQYMVALTHDVDFTSIRECRLTTVGYAAFQCFKQLHFLSGLKLPLAKFGIGPDPWDLFKYWEKLENDMNVRSTFFFVPKKGDPGQHAHPYRAINYIPDKTVLLHLQENGWEVGVHGIDNWIDLEESKKELLEISKEHPGNRTHWLLFNQKSWEILDSAGYLYDSTFGYNHTVGFRAGTLQVYKPANAKTLLELPLHIQDLGLFGKFCWEPSDDGWKKINCLHADELTAMKYCNSIFDYAKYYGGVVTVLWHYENIVDPRNWLKIYSYIIERTKNVDHAWVTNAENIVNWFTQRRNTSIITSEQSNILTITLKNYTYSPKLPALKLRVHIDPKNIKSVNGEYISTETYIDIKCDKSEFRVELI